MSVGDSMPSIKLTKNTKKVVLRREGHYKVAVGDECCKNIFVIIIWNSNCTKDDNFSIKVNGQEIGTINNDSDTCTGRIFADDINITVDDISSAILPCCPAHNFEPTIQIDPKNPPFQNGNNELKIESIQDNGNGSFGSVLIANLVKESGLYRPCGAENIANPNFYAHFSGVGNFSIVNFILP